jgi:O-antigen/teichoic acid export membrane protein
MIGKIVNLLRTFFLFPRKKSDLLYSPTLPRKKELFYLINGGFYLFLNGMAAQVIYNGDRIIVAKFVSIATLTIFTINIRTIEIIQMFVMKMSDVFIPKIIKVASENLDKAMIYYVSFTKISVIAVIFLQINFLLFNTSFIKLWVGEEFLLKDKSVIPLYLIVFFLHIVFRIPSLFLYAIGKNKQYSFVSLIEAVINLSLSIILARYFEIKGIVIATIIALFLTSIPSNLYFLNKYFEARISYYKSISPLIIPLLLLSPALIAAYLLNERVMKLITNWYLFFTFVILFNIIFLPIIVLINYRKVSLFFNDLKFLNSSAYK